MHHLVPWRCLQLLPPLPLRPARAGGKLAGAPKTVALQVSLLIEGKVQNTARSNSRSRKVTRYLTACQAQ